MFPNPETLSFFTLSGEKGGEEISVVFAEAGKGQSLSLLRGAEGIREIQLLFKEAFNLLCFSPPLTP